ncbi:unnamed protein product [Sympodiomycopsis kandeliae]
MSMNRGHRAVPRVTPDSDWTRPPTRVRGQGRCGRRRSSRELELTLLIWTLVSNLTLPITSSSYVSIIDHGRGPEWIRSGDKDKTGRYWESVAGVLEVEQKNDPVTIRISFIRRNGPGYTREQTTRAINTEQQ